jgi:hypothetical protein
MLIAEIILHITSANCSMVMEHKVKHEVQNLSLTQVTTNKLNF